MQHDTLAWQFFRFDIQGFSYVDNETLLVTSDEGIVNDLVTLVKTLFQNHQELQDSPLYIIAESYGGKPAILLGLALDRAVKEGTVKLIIGGNKNYGLGKAFYFVSSFSYCGHLL